MAASSDPSSPRKKQRLDQTPSCPQPQDDVSNQTSVVAQLDGTDDGIEAGVAGSSTEKISTNRAGIENLKRDKELSVSIIAFSQPKNSRIHGVAKKRYTDFLVNEILPSGEVVHLRELSLPVNHLRQDSRDPVSDSFNPQAVTTTKAEIPPSNENAPSGDAQKVETKERQTSKADPPADYGVGTHKIPSEEASRVKSTDLEASVESSKGNGSGLQTAPETTPADSAEKAASNDTEEAALAKWQAFATQVSVCKLPEKDRVYLGQFFAPEAIEKAEALYNSVLASPGRPGEFYGTVDMGKVEDKATRSVIHKAIRQIFRERLESSADQEGTMTLRYNSPCMPGWKDRHTRGGKRDGPARGRMGTNASRNVPRPRHSDRSTTSNDKLAGQYMHFSLLKENRDTLEVVSFLARQLRKSPGDFQFAGTKDRRGVTVQRISGPAFLHDALKRLTSELRTAHIGDFKYSSSALELGELTGNEFVITIRDVDVEGLEGAPPENWVAFAQERITAAVSDLAKYGFINYFGLQRFGSYMIRTDTIGMRLFMRDFKGVVDAILGVNPATLAAAEDDNSISRDERLRAQAISSFRTSDRGMPALSIMPRRFVAETALIRHLTSRAGRKSDWEGAVSTIPRTQRMLYLHAYQSHIWNIVATHRWNSHSDRVVEGDLVFDASSHAKPNASTQPPQSDPSMGNVDADGEVVLAPAAHDRAAPTQDRVGYVRPLSAEDAASGNYSIFDVVLPLPGRQMTYPPNLVDFYVNTMREERFGGLGLHEMPTKIQGINIGGGYRALLARPGADWDARVVAYEDEDRQLVMTDKDRLLKEGKLEAPKPKDGEEGPAKWPMKLVGDFDDKGLPCAGQTPLAGESESKSAQVKLAAVVRMQLGAGTYATMALREMSKGGIRMYEPAHGRNS